MTKPHLIYRDHEGNGIYVQTLKTRGTWKWSGRDPHGRLLPASTVKRIMSTGHFQRVHGAFAQLSAVEAAKRTRHIKVLVKGPMRRRGKKK